MGEFARMFQEGGVLMFPVLGGGAVAVATGVLAPFLRSRSLASAALIAASLSLAIGVFAWLVGMEEVEEAVRTVSPEQEARVREIGGRIAGIPLRFAALGAIPGFIGGILGFALSRKRATTVP